MFNLGALAGGLVAVGALTAGVLGGFGLDPTEPPTRTSCFLEYANALQILYEDLANAQPPWLPEEIRIALEGLRIGLEMCLSQVPTPNPAPTRSACLGEYIIQLKECRRRFPAVPGPVLPGTVLPTRVPNIAFEFCAKAAHSTYALCMAHAPLALAGSLEPTDDTLTIASGQKYLLLKLTVTGDEIWCPTFTWLTLDQQDQEGTVNSPYADCHVEHGGIEVVVSIPEEVFTARTDAAVLVVSIKDRLGNIMDAGSSLVIVQWPDGDLDRDGFLTGNDVAVATQMYVNGEFTLAQLNAVIALVQNQP